LSHVPEEGRESLCTLLSSWKSLFSLGDFDMGHTDRVKHQIQLKDPNQVPIKQRYRRIPPSMFQEVREHIKMMLDCDVIRPSSSPWSSPVVLVRKSDGGLHFCVDFRQVNECTKKDAFDIPRIDETIDCLKGAKYFSCLDLKAGYWQVEIEEQHKEITAFSVGPLGFYEFNSMPFGLCNSPATFQRLMERCLHDLNLEQCLIYLDDIIVFAPTLEEHLVRLEAVFERLHRFGLKLKPSKCQFLRTEVKYLGHIVSAAGVSVDPSKVEVLQKMSAPTSVKELQRFLGFIGYHRRFIPQFSSIARPLNDLLKGKRSSFCWEEEHQKAFETLIKHTIESPVLAFADFQAPFILQVDASLSGLGAMLMQEQGGEKKVIAYASRSLSASERRYPVHKLEFLALKWAVTEKFHDYLYGSQFEVITDNNPLTYVLTSAKLDATSHRWIAALASYNFSIRYQPGSQNVCADFLSRMSSTWQSPEMVQAILQRPVEEVGLCLSACVEVPEGLLTCPSVRVYDMKKLQREDNVINAVCLVVESGQKPSRLSLKNESSQFRALVKQFKKLFFQDGVLYRRAVIDNDLVDQLIVPSSLRRELLVELHDNMGHVGRDRTLDLVRRRVYWPGWYKDVLNKVQHCRNCVCRKTPTDVAPLVSVVSTQPLELVCMDYLSLEPSQGYANILVITDHFSKFAVAVPTKNQSAVTTARALYQDFIVRYGTPRRIHSDQGANFMSKVIKELCALLEIDKSRTTPYHPMGNGLCERFNRTLLQMLGCLAEEKKRSWKNHLASVIHAYNCTRHASTGFSPYELLFGRTPVLPVDVRFGLGAKSRFTPHTEFVQDLHDSLQAAWKVARENQEHASTEQKAWYDRHQHGFGLDPGDHVLVREVGFQGPHKLANRWSKETYVVLSQTDPEIPVYVVKQQYGAKKRTLHRNMLLPVSRRLEPDPERTPPPLPKTSPPPMPPVLAESDSEEEQWIVDQALLVPPPVSTRPPQPSSSPVSVDTAQSSSAEPAPREQAPVTLRRSSRVKRPPERFADLEW